MMKSKKLLLEQIVFEVKYKQGYRYLDRCGETMIEIENKLPGWIAGEAIPTGGKMRNEGENMTFNFDSLKFDIAKQNAKDLQNFITHSKTIFNIVSSNLGLEEYKRFGLRCWFLFPVNSQSDGRKILSECKTYSVNKDIEKLFGKSIKDTSIVVVLEEEQKSHRISLTMVYKSKEDIIKDDSNKLLETPPHKLPTGQKEALRAQLQRRKKQKEQPEMAILIDIDSDMKYPQVEFLDNFIHEAIKLSEENALKLIGG